MATRAERGTKRTCQNNACGARFYDLNRDPIACPMCSAQYVLPVAAGIAAAGAGAEAPQRRAARKPEFEAVSAGEGPEIEVDDTLADVEGAEEEIAAGDEETFLEPEEDEGGDVSGIIGGPATEGEEEP